MKILRTPSRGSITLVALSLAIVIGISLASYLSLCKQSLLLSNRTIQLIKTRQLAETGLEEALWSLNAYANPDTSISATAWTSISATMPTVSVSNVSWGTSPSGKDKSCTITGYDLGNGATGKVEITITSYDGPKAAVTLPIASAQIPAPTITATATVSVPGMGDFKRTLTAPARPAPLFANALGVINGNNGHVIFLGGGMVDSWDSDYLENVPITIPATPRRDYNVATANILYPGSSPITTPATTIPYAPLYSFVSSPANTYPSLSYNYAATIASQNIVLGGAEVRGYAMTYGNAISTMASKIVAPPSAGTPPTPPNIDVTRVTKSAFVPNFPVAAPTGAQVSTLDGLTSITIDNSAGSTPQIWDASSTDLTLNGTTVTIKGHVIIRVLGKLDLISGGKFLIYKPAIPGLDTGRLEIYVGGNIRIGDVTTSNAGFQNDTEEPKRLSLFSTSTSPSRTFQYYTTLPYCGVMYSAAPDARIEFLATSPVIYGAIFAKNDIRFNAGTNPTIHYDIALQYLPKGWFKGITTPFMLDQVSEVP